MMEFDPIKSAIIYCYRGSIAHNMYIPPDEPMSTDDVDLFGVFIAPIDHYWGLKRFENQEIKNDQDDIVFYDIRKFVRLLIKSNPNVMSILWNDPTMYLHLTDEGNAFIENREMFSSQKAYESFGGYAKSQLKKMFSGAYRGYMGEKRKVLVDKFGYDTKNAAHLIRLLRMGIKFLRSGVIEVYREKDRDELIAIKRGEWTQGQVEREANKLFTELDGAKSNSKLPESPDYEKINDFLVDVMGKHFPALDVRT